MFCQLNQESRELQITPCDTHLQGEGDGGVNVIAVHVELAVAALLLRPDLVHLDLERGARPAAHRRAAVVGQPVLRSSTVAVRGRRALGLPAQLLEQLQRVGVQRVGGERVGALLRLVRPLPRLGQVGAHQVLQRLRLVDALLQCIGGSVLVVPGVLLAAVRGARVQGVVVSPGVVLGGEVGVGSEFRFVTGFCFRDRIVYSEFLEKSTFLFRRLVEGAGLDHQLEELVLRQCVDVWI